MGKEIPNQNERQEQAKETINGLSPELKAVAEEYLQKGNSQIEALEIVRSQEAINNLPPKLKAIAEKYLQKGSSPSGALEIVASQETILKYLKKN